MDSLTAHPPELFLDTSTAGIRHYGAYPVRLVPEVARFLRAHYRRTETADGVALYHLNPILTGSSRSVLPTKFRRTHR